MTNYQRNKAFAIVIFLIIVAAVGYALYRQSVKPAVAPTTGGQNSTTVNLKVQTGTSSAPTGYKPAATSTPAQTQSHTATQETQGTYSSGDTSDMGSNISVVEVDFNGSAFAPASITINVNDWVFFKNKSTAAMWVASNPHPTHTDYPGFDSLKAIAPGGEYKFQFTKAGTWGYHDHLNPGIGGVVIVNP